ncbi:hypothetical protein P8C59_008892 [Phyllachora maydis]|uniref:Uncharacterized protein n=1 Tax=Phyllachora maydis TaxID=1825666 RepID=A0AAD9IBJ0_9PEZI|nr:hypothetical protein P8C59_008892 [Phyllachora maydis]
MTIRLCTSRRCRNHLMMAIVEFQEAARGPGRRSMNGSPTTELRLRHQPSFYAQLGELMVRLATPKTVHDAY